MVLTEVLVCCPNASALLFGFVKDTEGKWRVVVSSLYIYDLLPTCRKTNKDLVCHTTKLISNPFHTLGSLSNNLCFPNLDDEPLGWGQYFSEIAKTV